MDPLATESSFRHSRFRDGRNRERRIPGWFPVDNWLKRRKLRPDRAACGERPDNPGRRMKTVQVLFTAGFLCIPVTFPIAQTAQARLYCLSLRFQQGASDAGNFTLDLSTIAPPSPPNGELAPSFDDPNHSSGFILEDHD